LNGIQLLFYRWIIYHTILGFYLTDRKFEFWRQHGQVLNAPTIIAIFLWCGKLQQVTESPGKGETFAFYISILFGGCPKYFGNFPCYRWFLGYNYFHKNIAIADEFIELHISKAQAYLENLVNILASGYVSREGILQAAREILASIGETHSAFVLTNILTAKGLKAKLVDLSGFDDQRPFTIDERIKDAFSGIDLQTCVCIVTGYAKGTEGIMREFDRGYSEVTFSKIAEILKPEEAIIHKEYHLSTADPALVGLENCKPVGYTNYDIADQLADVGMEAIHPKASKPLEMNGINLRIKNTFEPSHPGTLITRSYVSALKRVEVITGIDKLMLIDVFDPLMVGNVGSDLQIMQLFYKHGVSYTFKATSANSISIVIWEADFKQELITDLQTAFEKISVEKVAMVCLLGSNMDQPGLLAKAATALAKNDINIVSAGFALRKVNIQFLIAREQFKTAIVALNEAVG
jgi:aspartate kinase